MVNSVCGNRLLFIVRIVYPFVNTMCGHNAKRLNVNTGGTCTLSILLCFKHVVVHSQLLFFKVLKGDQETAKL
jgi:hypothetical protein